jgi:hypothetical protein
MDIEATQSTRTVVTPPVINKGSIVTATTATTATATAKHTANATATDAIVRRTANNTTTTNAAAAAAASNTTTFVSHTATAATTTIEDNAQTKAYKKLCVRMEIARWKYHWELVSANAAEIAAQRMLEKSMQWQ